MGVYLYNPCIPNLRKTEIPYSVCGAPMGLKFTEEEFQEVLPNLINFRDSSTIEVDYVFNQSADGEGVFSPPSRYTVNADFSGQASRDDSFPITYSSLQEDGTYRNYRHPIGVNPLTINFCDSFPPLKWVGAGVYRTDCVESGGEECSGYWGWSCIGYDFGSMCWHPAIHRSTSIMVKLIIPCGTHYATPGVFRKGSSCWVMVEAKKKTNQSCCYTHVGGKGNSDSSAGVSQIDIRWGGVSKTPEGDYVVFTPTVNVFYKAVIGSWGGYWGAGQYTERWGDGCLCTPIEFVHLLGRVIPYEYFFRSAAICSKDSNYRSYDSCGGRIYMQGGTGYFPRGPSENSDPANGTVTPYVYRGDGSFTPGRGNPFNYNKPTPPGNGAYYEVLPDSTASWRFSNGCWEFGTSNYESESCGSQSFAVYIRLCPGNIVNYESAGGCKNF